VGREGADDACRGVRARSLAALRLPAQSAGKFSGIISDPSGMPVANATVIMDNHKWDGVHGFR